MEETLELKQKQEIAPKMSKKRIAWIDFAKFIGILLVIIGHRVGIRELNMVIFSFHVPVFFILSGITFSFSTDAKSFGKKTLKRFCRLMIPYFIAIIAVYIVVIIRTPSQASSLKFWTYQFYRLIGYSSANFLSTHALWFLLALFVSSTIFDLLHLACKDNDWFLGILSGILALIGVILGKLEYVMPLSLDVSIAVVIFLFIGYKLKNFDFGKKPLVRNIVLLIVWVATMAIMWHSTANGAYMAIGNRRYTLFPICYICAFAGSMLFLQVIYWIEKYLPKVMTQPFSFLGQYTLYMVCIHGFDQFTFKYWFKVSENTHINNLIYFAVGTAMFFVVLGADLIIHYLMKQKRANVKEA